MMSSNSSDKNSNSSRESIICINLLNSVIEKSSNVHKLIDSIEGLGCAIPQDFFNCIKCNRSDMSGGFNVDDKGDHSRNSQDYKPKIVLCEENMLEKDTFTHTVTHELIHAYDACRSNLDVQNCAQHACTEIRASALSGECSVLHEALRGHMQITKGHQDCVRRRATKSVEANSHCKDSAKAIVDSVFFRCYSDRSPFEPPKI